MKVRYWPALFLAAGLLTACSSGPSSTKAAACEEAPDTVVSAISEGFNNSTFELHDAKMVKVPPGEQNDAGYPSAVGVWAIDTADEPAPIFALNPGAQQLTPRRRCRSPTAAEVKDNEATCADWGAAIKDGSPMAKNRDITARLDAAKDAPDCL